ncbi:MAG: hypothetical protein ACOH18_01705 [Candidatus Saccharimonadaceae bacterium]
MTILAKVSPAPKPRTKRVRQISLLYAGILVVFLVAQLFTFDKFIELIPSFNLPLSDGWSYALAPIIVASELFALPFLLGMKLSIAFRWLSMVLGWLVPALWLYICLWVVLTQPNVESVGFLGTVVDLVPGWWAVMKSLALGVLAAWASWGLWPGSRSKTKK